MSENDVDLELHPVTGEPQIEPRPEGVPDNTKAQEDNIAAMEERWAKEQKWPTWRVHIAGDDQVWVPRADERYWMSTDINDSRAPWVPRPASELPEDAYLDDNGNVVRQNRGDCVCKARTEEEAKMIALRDNTDYHTVLHVEKLSG